MDTEVEPRLEPLEQIQAKVAGIFVRFASRAPVDGLATLKEGLTIGHEPAGDPHRHLCITIEHEGYILLTMCHDHGTHVSAFRNPAGALLEIYYWPDKEPTEVIDEEHRDPDSVTSQMTWLISELDWALHDGTIGEER